MVRYVIPAQAGIQDSLGVVDLRWESVDIEGFY
jgi:hypothetical protein